MSSYEFEKLKEQERIDLVVNVIEQQISKLEQQSEGTKEQILELRKTFFDEVKVNIDDPFEVYETYFTIKQQSELLSERERMHRHAGDRLNILKTLIESPYFGRIDFTEEGFEESEQIYLGISSLLDEETGQFLIYDWRAPISSLYYDYAPGPCQYKTPNGTIFGTMDLKRQYIIRNRKLHSMFDSGITIGDELLQEVLGQHSSAQMKNIVATIQKEQNRIIRNEHSHLLIVSGSAGSGKTSAALQRVAYLLYRFRDTLKAEQIVLFSPNEMFNHYISTVLPQLGERNMQQTTMQEYLKQRIGRDYQTVEEPFTQLEYVHTSMNTPQYSTRIEAIHFKSSIEFMRLIDKYIETLGKEGMKFKDISFRDEILLSKEQIAEKFYSLDSSIRIPNRVDLLVKWILEHIKERARIEKSKPWVEEELQYLSPEDYQMANQQIQKRGRKSSGADEDFDHEEKWLIQLVINRHFKPLRELVKNQEFIDIPAIYRQLFTTEWLSFKADVSLPQNWEEICAYSIQHLNRSELLYEDATPYVFLKNRIIGSQTYTFVRHVIIDEAQDYSPFQFVFIKNLFPSSKMTVLGDPNQAIHAHSDRIDFSRLPQLLAEEKAEHVVLHRSYRSTRPIIEFTRGMIPGGEAIEPFNREGLKPTITQTSDKETLKEKITSRIKMLQEKAYRTIAIICKTYQEAQDAYHLLNDRIPLRLAGNESASFEHGIIIIPSYLAKGIEFDAVIVYNASQAVYGTEIDRKLLYTACTRAMHELHLYSIGELSPYIKEILPDLYLAEE